MPPSLGTIAGRTSFSHPGDPSSLSLNRYMEKFKKLHAKAMQQIKELAQEALEKKEVPTVDLAGYTKRRQAQADKWLKEVTNECRLHAAWLAKGGSPSCDKKLEEFECKLNRMDLHGRFEWVGASSFCPFFGVRRVC